ncbi:response regulator transcription factor [Nocardioides deserti]|uniref:Response regulator transcription factor n=1 Tax=Nocardioides deserti TaxID=1588644 RepID=A0ABR6UF82_9ACTN|nr:response regulator transcription factor [Nocardioides deserti]MBC2962471.1 response regulator transcription factor [Nocardioides deserti]
MAVVVEEDPDQARLVVTALQRAGFRVAATPTGQRARELVARHRPELVTVDLGLSDVDGLEVCRQVRQMSDCYLLVVSGHADEASRLAGLEAGADDVLTEPLSVRELQVRVAAVLRRPDRLHRAARSRPRSTRPGRPGPDRGRTARIDAASRRVLVGEDEVVLTSTELAMLARLVDRAGAVCTREELQALTYASAGLAPTNVVSVHVSNLRTKLRGLGLGEAISTVRGVGYRLDHSAGVQVLLEP